MSRLGMNLQQVLSRCVISPATMGVAPVRIATPLGYRIRQVSTTPSKKAARAASPAVSPKDKTAKFSAATTRPKMASSKAAASAAAPEQPVPAAEGPRSDTAASAEGVKPALLDTLVEPPGLRGSDIDSKDKWMEAEKALDELVQKMGRKRKPKAYIPSGSLEPLEARPSTSEPSSPEYKRAARKWTSTMVALPFLFVTSYFLYQRLVLGEKPSLEPLRAKPQTDSAAKGA